MAEIVLKLAKKANSKIQTKVFQISELKIESCYACYESCCKEPYKCIIEDDFLTVFEEMKRSQAIIIS